MTYTMIQTEASISPLNSCTLTLHSQATKFVNRTTDAVIRKKLTLQPTTFPQQWHNTGTAPSFLYCWCIFTTFTVIQAIKNPVEGVCRNCFTDVHFHNACTVVQILKRLES